MKRTLTLLAFSLIFTCSLMAQKNNLVVFSEGGERFFLIVNGLKQNSESATNVKVVDLNQPNYVLKVIYENKSIPDLDKRMTFLNPGTEVVLAIKNKNGTRKLAFISEAPISDTEKPAEQKLVVYNAAPQTTEVTTTTTTTTSQTTPVATNNVNVTNSTTAGTTGVSINVNENGMNMSGTGMNVNVTATGMNMDVKESTVAYNATSNTNASSTTTTTTVVEKKVATQAASPASSNSPCNTAMTESDFKAAKSSIASKSFEDSKLTVAKQVMKSKCMSSAQVKEVMGLFSFEETKLSYAKDAYAYTIDKDNYYLLNDAFDFETSIEELNKYIDGKK